jgi:hypothetical protein
MTEEQSQMLKDGMYTIQCSYVRTGPHVENEPDIERTQAAILNCLQGIGLILPVLADKILDEQKL